MTARVFWGLIVFLAGLLIAILGFAYFENHAPIALFVLAGILLMDFGSDHLFLRSKRRRLG